MVAQILERRKARYADAGYVPLDTDRIRALREKLGLTQEEAAQRAGLHGRQGWNRIERGKLRNITLDVLERIARTLNVHAKDLLK